LADRGRFFTTGLPYVLIAHLNGELNLWGNRSYNSAFDFNGDPEVSRKPRRTFSDKV